MGALTSKPIFVYLVIEYSISTYIAWFVSMGFLRPSLVFFQVVYSWVFFLICQICHILFPSSHDMSHDTIFVLSWKLCYLLICNYTLYVLLHVCNFQLYLNFRLYSHNCHLLFIAINDLFYSLKCVLAVSYTHLTLPTICSV